MKLNRSFRNYNSRGFTLIELLAATSAGLLILSFAVPFTSMFRDTMGNDIAKSRISSSLRGGMDIIGADIRVAGENLPSVFPAVELTNGASGAADTLYLRRNLLDEILPVCAASAAGATTITFANNSTVAGCSYSGQTTAYNSWRNYRISQGGTVRAYIFNTVTKLGEFIRYNNDVNGGTSYSVRTASGLTRAYPAGSSAMYMLEEWRINLASNSIQIQTNQDATTLGTISFGITNMQVSILMQDATTKTAFTTADAWDQIKSIDLTLTGVDEYRNQNITRSLIGKFFPRNVLSN